MIYERFDQEGRLLTGGLLYCDSWVSRDKNVCFQLLINDIAGSRGHIARVIGPEDVFAAVMPVP